MSKIKFDEVLLMKQGKFVLQGTVPELVQKADGKVWELEVSSAEAKKWQTNSTVANLRHEGRQVVLRIISDDKPSERAVPCEATLEDLYLYYFPYKYILHFWKICVVTISADYCSSPNWYFVYTACGKKLVKTVEGLIENGKKEIFKECAFLFFYNHKLF